MTSFFFGNMEKFMEHLNEKHPTIKFTAELSQTWINSLDVTVSLIDGEVTTDLYVKPTDINISTLLHVTHITAKREFHTAKLYVLTESVQTLILLIEDVMILKSG